MPDGKRRRRFSSNLVKRKWYALYRSLRFRQRFNVGGPETAEFGKAWLRSQLGTSLG